MKKTLVASLPLTRSKRALLDWDYENYQWWVQFGIDNGILSAFKAYKQHYQKNINYRDYPLPIRQQLIKEWFRIRKTQLTPYWIKIPNSKRKGQGLWIPLQFHQSLPKQFTICDSFLVQKKGSYYFHLVIDMQTPELYVPETTIGIDLGLKNPFTLVNIDTRKTHFLGKELKQTKGKYYYLRKKFGQNKNFKTIKRLANKEQRKTNTLLHKITKQVVMYAKENNTAIIVGCLKNLKKDKGKKTNRKLGGFSYYKTIQYLVYKAQEEGVPLITVNEAFTSRNCSVCGSSGTRRKNWFTCQACGYSDNADRNAAFNIGQRGFNYMLESGVHAYAQKSITTSIVNG